MNLKVCVLSLALVVGLNSANATIITEYSNGSTDAYGNTISAPASSIGAVFNIDGIATVTIPNSPALIGGYAVVDTNLDNTNTGTIQINASEVHFQNISLTTNIGSAGSLDITVTGLQASIFSGPISVVDGDFDITSSTTGAIDLNGGLLTITGTILGEPVNTSLNLSTSPIDNTFSHDGNPSFPGTATQSSSSATLGLDYNGLVGFYNFTLGGINFPTNITWTGSVNAAAVVPETSSLLLAAMGLVAFAVPILKRLKGATK